jgi:hypothetical protein
LVDQRREHGVDRFEEQQIRIGDDEEDQRKSFGRKRLRDVVDGVFAL